MKNLAEKGWDCLSVLGQLIGLEGHWGPDINMFMSVFIALFLSYDDNNRLWWTDC